jgi:hypothetical protein
MVLWKQFELNGEYLISNDGQVKNNRTGRILKGGLNRCGYRYYFLLTNGGYGNDRGKWFFAHRLVAIHFIENPDNLPEVNHKDSIKLNNQQDNLEWCTHKQNIQHSYAEGKRPANHRTGKDNPNYGTKRSAKTKRMQSLAKIGTSHPKFTGYYIVNGIQYASAREAEHATGINQKTILRRCKRRFPIEGFSFIKVL